MLLHQSTSMLTICRRLKLRSIRSIFSENVIRSYTLDNETSAGRQARKVNDSNLSLGDLFTLLRFSKSLIQLDFWFSRRGFEAAREANF